MLTMEFKREIQSRLEEWRRSSRRKPLVLRGARQVGKTTVVNQFGRTFDNYIYPKIRKQSQWQSQLQ